MYIQKGLVALSSKIYAYGSKWMCDLLFFLKIQRSKALQVTQNCERNLIFLR